MNGARFRFLARAAATAGLVLVTAWAVRAASGDSPRSLSFAGTIGKVTGSAPTEPIDVTFRFKRADSVVCESIVEGVRIDPATSNAHLDVPLTDCEAAFDGSELTLDVVVGTRLVAAAQPVAPVPHARYAASRGSSDCPAGYARMADANTTLCQRKDDQVVKVGSGSAAFWIDRYEASVFGNPDATDTQYGRTTDDYPPSFPDTGDYTSALFAVSKAGVVPSRFITWFQASEACRASGKRLPTMNEWLGAARRTPDPGASAAAGPCYTQGSAPHDTGERAECRSAFGVYDMIGNLAEWTSAWQSGVGDGSLPPSSLPSPGYRDDGVWNVASRAFTTGSARDTSPAAAVRGGSFLDGTGAGVFAVDFRRAPQWSGSEVGFRCVTPR